MALANERQEDGPAKLSKEDQEDVATMNAAIDRMRSFTPADPYVLTIPQEVEPRYHHHYAAQARQWLEHTPFKPHEDERTQYQTFVYHEPSKGIYMLHNSRPPDTGTNTITNGDGETRGAEKVGTGANTPNAGPKKKISLDAYKKKQTGQTPEMKPAKEMGQAVKRQAAKRPIERLKEDEEVLAAVEEDASLHATQEAVPVVVKNELKRKRDEEPVKVELMEKHDNEHVQHDTPTDSTEPVTKKVKQTTPPEEPASNYEKHPTTQPAVEASSPPEKASTLAMDLSNEDKLPPKLSPPPQDSEDESMPPRLSPILMITPLPARLSPTIPATIDGTLKAQEHLETLSRSSDKSLSKDAVGRTLTPPPIKSGKKKSPAPRNGFRANSSSPAVRSDAEERGRPATSVPKGFKLSDAESAEESEEIAVSRKRKALPEQHQAELNYPGKIRAVDSQSRDLQPEKPTLVVKLKFKKNMRDRVRSLLRMKPVPEKTPASQSPLSKTAAASGARRNSNTKGIAQKIRPPHTMNGAAKKAATQQTSDRKRGRSDDTSDSDAPATKRKRATTDASEPRRNEPTTPVRSDVLSPSSGQKLSSQLSPNNLRKELLSAPMKRELSTDSTMHTPNAASQYSPMASTKEALQTSNATSKPRSSQPSSKTPKQQAWEKEHRRLELVGRDLKRAVPIHKPPEPALSSSDQKLAPIIALESVLAFILAFTCADEAALTADPKQPPSVRPWITMQPYFGFVKKNCEPFPALHGLACYLGVVFNAHILDLAAQHPGETVSKDQLLETQTMMQRAANDAESKLDIDVLQSTFSHTWTKRDRGQLGQSKLEPGKGFAGTFKLPIGMQTSPLRAVRAGCAMLEEWVEAQDGLNYELKLKL